jgi:hypothetical protein
MAGNLCSAVVVVVRKLAATSQLANKDTGAGF